MKKIKESWKNNKINPKQTVVAILIAAASFVSPRPNWSFAEHNGIVEGYRSVGSNPDLASKKLLASAIHEYNVGRYEEAIKILESCLYLGESAEVRFWLGKSHQGLGEYIEAEAYLWEAAKASPEDINIKAAIIRLYTEWGEKTQDLKMFEKIDSTLDLSECKHVDPGEHGLKDIPIASKSGKTHIISIGINRYSAGSRASLEQLHFAEHDAEMVAGAFHVSDFLGKKGSEIILLGRDATRKEILRSIKGISNLAVDDRLVIYFAGHGFSSGGSRYWVPFDARPGDRSLVISLEELNKICATLNLKQKPIVIMDACSENIGYFDPPSGKNQYDPSVLISSDNDNLILLSGTSVGEKGLETKVLSGGLFTRALISSIADLSRDGNIQSSSLLDLYFKANDKMNNFNREFSVNQNIDFGGCY